MRPRSTPVRVEANKKVLQLAGNSHAEVARILGYPNRRNVWPWTRALKPFQPKHCIALELRFPGQITRQELRPHDWEAQWPDLALAEKQRTEAEATKG